MGTVYVFNATSARVGLSVWTDTTDPKAVRPIPPTDCTATPPYTPNSTGVARDQNPPLGDGTAFIDGATNHVSVDIGGHQTSSPVDLAIPADDPQADLWLYVSASALLLFNVNGKLIGSGTFTPADAQAIAEELRMGD
jgi:hypothetical protein